MISLMMLQDNGCFSGKLEELQASKDRDQKYYSDQISKLQQEIAKYQKVCVAV